MTDGPLIVQSDKTLLLEVDHEQAAGHDAEQVVDALVGFSRFAVPAAAADGCLCSGRRAGRALVAGAA